MHYLNARLCLGYFLYKSKTSFLLSRSPNRGWMVSYFQLLTEARICLCNVRMYGHAPLLMGIYNNYSGYNKVRRRLYVNEPSDTLNLSGKNI